MIVCRDARRPCFVLKLICENIKFMLQKFDYDSKVRKHASRQVWSFFYKNYIQRKEY